MVHLYIYIFIVDDMYFYNTQLLQHEYTKHVTLEFLVIKHNETFFFFLLIHMRVSHILSSYLGLKTFTNNIFYLYYTYILLKCLH